MHVFITSKGHSYKTLYLKLFRYFFPKYFDLFLLNKTVSMMFDTKKVYYINCKCVYIINDLTNILDANAFEISFRIAKKLQTNAISTTD